MKVMLLAGLYLFFVRVLWSVFSELRDPRTVVRKRRAPIAEAGPGPAPGATFDQPVPAAAQSPAQPAHHAALQPAGAQAGGAFAGSIAPAAAATVPAAPAAGYLYVLDPPELAGLHYELSRKNTVGRAETNDIIVDDTYVSTVHARIFSTKGTYFVEDLDSRNGSMLNGTPLVATTALVPGDRLQFGATLMEFS